MSIIKKDSILIVDDNKKNLDVLVELLKEFDVICTLEAQNVLGIIQNEDIDLILLDIMMPKIDGFELCKLLKSDDKTKNIPVIFLTAKVDTSDIQKGFELGAVDYVTKPFHPLELKMRVNTHLKLYRYQKALEVEVNKRLQEVQYTQQLLFQKNKQSEMSEFSMHIAHQWGQPLSELGSINNLQLAKVQMDHKITTKEYEEFLRKNEKIIQFMSDTVSTFQDFYKNKDIDNFSMIDALKEIECLVSATLDYYGIDFIMEYEEEVISKHRISGKQNELAQIFLSLINNSKNIFLKIDKQKKFIQINIQEKLGNLMVTIEDNAGGIKEENLETIFEPYISYCASSGIGLYMVKTICDKNKWPISLKNTQEGVKFEIICKEYEK